MFIEQKKDNGEILKSKEFLTEEWRELENAKGSEHEFIFTFKIAFLECIQTGSFYHKQSRPLFCLQDKGVAQSILENFGFHNEYDDEYRKCLSYSGLCRPISAILRMLNGCSVLEAK